MKADPITLEEWGRRCFDARRHAAETALWLEESSEFFGKDFYYPVTRTTLLQALRANIAYIWEDRIVSAWLVLIGRAYAERYH